MRTFVVRNSQRFHSSLSDHEPDELVVIVVVIPPNDSLFLGHGGKRTRVIDGRAVPVCLKA